MSRLGVDSVVQDFRIEKFLGKGSYGAVYRVKRQTDGKVYAMKQINTQKMTQKEREDAVNEIRILASVESPYIIKFNEAFVHNMNLYIITEYAGNGDMFQRLRRLAQKRQMMPEDKAWVFFIQLAIGIQALHRNNILHRDLKSANVFLSNKNMIKIGDLGVAKLLAATRAMAKTQIGTPYYVSPELWKNKPYNAKSDIWALGCLLYEMITGKPPFDSNDMRGLARKVMRGVYPPVSSHYSQDIKDVIAKLLAVNPSHRPSVDDILKMPQVVARMSLLPPSETGAPPSTAQSVKSARSDLVGTIHVPRKLRDLTSNLPNPRYDDPVPQPPPAEQQGGRDRLPDLPGAEKQSQQQQQQQPQAPKQPQEPKQPEQGGHHPAPPPASRQPGGHAAAPHPGHHYAPQRGPGSSSSARQYAPPHSGGSARSRGGHSRHPSSSRYASGRSSGQAPSGYRNQADYYGPYHRRNQGTGQSAAGGGSGHYYAGSQYARAGYAAGQQAGGVAGHGEWERAIEARLARVLGPSYSRRHSQRASGLRG